MNSGIDCLPLSGCWNVLPTGWGGQGFAPSGHVAQFDDLGDVAAKREQLESIVRAWCEWKDSA
jgi:hypothetical protein